MLLIQIRNNRNIVAWTVEFKLNEIKSTKKLVQTYREVVQKSALTKIGHRERKKKQNDGFSNKKEL